MLIRLLVYYNFVLLTIMTLVGFLGAQNFKELSSAVFFFPMAVYFGLMVVPHRSRTFVPLKARTLTKRPLQTLNKETNSEPLDTDKRKFLKLIGSASLALFLFAIFTKKAHGAFFGSVPGPGVIGLKDTAGNLIDPARNTPTDGYEISEIYDGSPSYYGLVDKGGKWFIIQASDSGTYLYTRGDSDFSNATTGWPNRVNLTYGYFNSLNWG